MKLTRLFNDFFNSERAGGLILIACTLLSVIITNSPFEAQYLTIWNFSIAHHNLVHWINDGLMAIFFLLIGLELEREIYIGELSNLKQASLPICAALGGMVMPAVVHLILNYNNDATRAGAGIPMATDIAFALGILSLLGNRVPAALKVLLTALAVIDDLGAIIVIAIFYTEGLLWMDLIIALSIFGSLLVLNRLKVHNLIPYLIGGVAMWYFMLHSGVHATITGVLLAFAIPFGDGGEKSPSYILQHHLHKPVAFIILPIFALANTSIAIPADWYSSLLESNSAGIMMGLIVGKPLGIALFSYLAVIWKISVLHEDIRWKQLIGAGFLGGIGFTMSIFITLLAFESQQMINQSKIAVMIASAIAGVIGYLLLKNSLPREGQTLQ